MLVPCAALPCLVAKYPLVLTACGCALPCPALPCPALPCPAEQCCQSSSCSACKAQRACLAITSSLVALAGLWPPLLRTPSSTRQKPYSQVTWRSSTTQPSSTQGGTSLTGTAMQKSAICCAGGWHHMPTSAPLHPCLPPGPTSSLLGV